MANRRYKSLLHEMSNYVPSRDKEDIVEARAQHIITSAINLLNSIHENFDEEDAQLLEKRLLSSIKNKDIKRFNRQIDRIKGSKNEDI